jgi:hemoglobin-like flavoprotein
MSPQHKYLIRKSFAQLEGHGSVPALIFYKRLFELDAALRPLFKGDIELQAAKLLDMLGTLISHLERTALLEAELRLMGQRHATYGVLPEHYGTVGRALLDMLAGTLQADFTPEVREAWTTLYGAVAEAMQAGAAEVPALAGVSD